MLLLPKNVVTSGRSTSEKVVMADGVVSFGVQKLLELLSRESERLSGMNEQVDGLHRKLERLQSLLEDANGKKHESKRVRNFLKEVQDIVYDAEDVIESFLLKESRGEGEKGIKKRVKRFACFLVDRQRFASAMEGITKRISEVIEGFSRLGIQKIMDGGCSLSLLERQKVQIEIRETFSNGPENDLVGVEKSVEELVGRLVENDNNFQVVSITGMGGIGKTTLARQVFHHDIVRRRFDGFAWVCVSQNFTRMHIWQRILQDLRPNDDANISQMNEHTLEGKLFRLLETSKYLIVLDDVWKNEHWERIKAVFPPKKSWKILLTSRNEGVGLHADPTCFVFRPEFLTDEQSWKLCQRIVFPKIDEIEFRVDEEVEAMGKKMVTCCGGLPLAVKVLGGLLATKHSVCEWEKVCHNIGPHIVGGTSSGIVDDNNLNLVNRVLSLSYEDLPMHLKHCFVYLAQLPEDYNLVMDELFSLWAAEGMIVSCNDGSTIQETGEWYMDALVRRNMVTVRKKYGISRIQNCQIHDMMREVCLSKAEEDNFLQVFKVHKSTSTINSQSPHKPRRLVVHSDIGFQMLGHKNNSKVRSLLCFALGKDFRIKSAQVFQSLPLLRVLDLSWVKFKGGILPTSIGELIHLRFLSLFEAVVFHLPSSLRNLKLLLHLNLCVSFGFRVHVPNVFKDMLELRFLILPRSMHDKTKLELGDLVNLETLEGFSTKHNSVTDLLCMTKLRTLAVNLSDRLNNETLSSSLCELRNLKKLSLSGMAGGLGEKFLLDFIHLKDLSLKMYMPRFLLGQHRFPPHLAHISLQKCKMEKDPMPILEKLLHLKSVKLSWDAFVGKRVVCSESGFPQLRALKLYQLVELEEWIVEVGSMPCLHTLTIDNCKKLKELPLGLKHIISLKELRIRSMKKEWTEKSVPDGEDYYKVQHIPNVQFINCDE